MIVMGIVKKPSIEMYWTRDSMLSTPFFGRFMSRNRFQSILSNLQVTGEKPAGNTDKLYKVRPFLDMLETSFPLFFKPGRELAIDEGAIPFRGKVPFRVYNKSKPHKYHMKVYQLCDSATGYCLSFSPYTGKDEKEGQDGKKKKQVVQEELDLPPGIVDKRARLGVNAVVLHLLHKAGTLNLYHHLYTDNYYSSPLLFIELLKHKTYACGTVRANRAGVPKSFADMTLAGNKNHIQKKDVSFRRSADQELLALAYNDRKVVRLLSTIHSATEATHKRDYKGNDVWVPDIVNDYNNHMNGVDTADQVMAYYHLFRRSLKWTRKMLIHFFNMAVFNAHIMYNSRVGEDDKLTSCKFRLELANELLTKGLKKIGRVEEDGNTRSEKGHWPVSLPETKKRKKPYRRCHWCVTRNQKNRNFTSFQCESCLVPLHAHCFKAYHESKVSTGNVTQAFEVSLADTFDEEDTFDQSQSVFGDIDLSQEFD